ncbi:MAG: hypothetical protein CM15mP59_4890 [Flavobacteriaceae bacterium]|nr:MAG: hypothetical protein CM15mP59_4890 [Flavobacteriaceae bacterium]
MKAQSTGEKEMSLIGRYYVAFNSEYNKQLEELMNDGIEEEKPKQVPFCWRRKTCCENGKQETEDS